MRAHSRHTIRVPQRCVVWQLSAASPAAMLPIARALSAKRRRVIGKQPTPAVYAALRAEGFSEADLAALGLDARRLHVHYTHTHVHAHERPEPRAARPDD